MRVWIGGGGAARLEGLGGGLVRYGLAVVLLWIGAMKFTAYEAEGVRPLVAGSPPSRAYEAASPVPAPS